MTIFGVVDAQIKRGGDLEFQTDGNANDVFFADFDNDLNFDAVFQGPLQAAWPELREFGVDDVGQYTIGLRKLTLGTNQYTDTTISLKVTPPRAGDINNDGLANFTDFLIMSSNFGNEGQFEDGDLDGDGFIRFSDFLIFSPHFST